MIIISEDSSFVVLWSQLETVCCVLSSYGYAYAACFEFYQFDNTSDTFMLNSDYMFFTIFTISILIKLLKDYKISGSTEPVRDLSKITKRYLFGTFWIDFIPWIPFHWIIDFH